MGLGKMSVSEKMTALANAVRDKAELTGQLTIDDMTEAVNNLRVGGGTDTSDATASAADILAGKSAYVGGEKVTGTIQSLTGGTYTVAPGNMTFPAGRYTATEIVFKGEPNLSPDNVRNGVQIGNVTGAFSADGTAVAGDILEGKTAYVKGEKVAGTIKSVEASVEGNIVTIPSGYIAEEQVIEVDDDNLVADNIKAGVKILGTTGTFTSDATATASDIATGKTAYVNGEKLIGTMTGGGGSVFPLWQNIESRLFPVVFGARTMQTPSNKQQNFIVVDGKLLYIPQNMGEVKTLFPEMTWTYARTRMGSDNGRAYAISDGKLYHIHYNSSNEHVYTCLTPNITGITQVIDAPPDWVFFLSGTDVYLGSDDGPDGVVRIDGVSVSKIINQTAGYAAAIVITTDGSVAKLTSGDYDNSTGKWTGAYEILYNAKGDRFHFVYYAEPEEFEGGMGGGGYVLARRDSGLWYQTPGSSSWRKVYGVFSDPYLPDKNNLLGYCATYVEERFEYDEKADEERWWLEPYESTIAFCVAEDGKGYVFRAQCNEDGSLTGMAAEQLDGDDWQYLPPYMGSNETAWAQRNNKLYRIKSSRPSGEARIQLAFTECEKANPQGIMIAAIDKNLFFAPFSVLGADVDMTAAGGSFTLN